MHINHVAHRDIKLDNLLISLENNVIKFADFGLSELYDENN